MVASCLVGRILYVVRNRRETELASGGSLAGSCLSNESGAYLGRGSINWLAEHADIAEAPEEPSKKYKAEDQSVSQTRRTMKWLMDRGLSRH